LCDGDFGNNRVLEFEPPFKTGMGAVLVIGQPDFVTTDLQNPQTGISGPAVMAFDSSGNLWVPDFWNNRVLEFTSTPVPEFPTASLAIVALASRRFTSVRRLGR
jgi:hypothetical protein